MARVARERREPDGILSVAPQHHANVRVRGQSAIQHRQRVSHLLLQAADEGIRLQRLTQLLVVRFAAHRKICRQIVVGIPIAISATDPNFFAPHALPHGLEHEQLVAYPVDPLAAFLVMLDDQLAPAGSHNAADRDDLVEPECAPCYQRGASTARRPG